MELMLQQMLRQLPSKNEMPDLIVDVSQTALATGISNELFQPGPETPRSSTPRSRSRCAWWAPTTSSVPSSAASPRCPAS
jgi:hypothetical protein